MTKSDDAQLRPMPNYGVQFVTAAAATMTQLTLAAALQDVYDIAVGSMDFGSGFLDTDQINNLRVLGHAIGAAPLHQHNCRYSDGPNWKHPCTCDLKGMTGI